MQLAVRTAVDAHINDHSAGLDHIAGHKALAADGSHQNIGGGADLFEVHRLGVADRDRGVLGQQQQRRRLAHDVGAADDHRVLAGDLSAGGLDHPDAARRGAGQIARLTDLHPADIDGRKAVHILLRRDGVNNGLLVDLGRQRQLHQNTVDGDILRQLFHLGQQRLLRGVGGQVDAAALNAALRAVVDLAADIDLTGGVLAHQNDRQAGVDAPAFQLPDLFCGLGLRGCGQCLAVNDGCAHDTFPLSNIFFVRTERAKRCQLLHQQHLSPYCKRLPVIPAGPLFLRSPRCSNPAHQDARS